MSEIRAGRERCPLIVFPRPSRVARLEKEDVGGKTLRLIGDGNPGNGAAVG
jgi:hypothetical protein